MVLEDSQIFHLQFLKIEDYIQNFCHKFHIHNFYEPYTELRSEKFIFSIYSSIFHSQSWKTACFPALGQENRFSDLQTMNFFFSAWNENSTIIKEIHMPKSIKPLILRLWSSPEGAFWGPAPLRASKVTFLYFITRFYTF